MSAEEPKSCSVKSCNSKTFFKTGEHLQELAARKALITSWSCVRGHIQQTETTMIPDDWEDYVYPGIWTI